MARYDVIWNHLKLHSTCAITSPAPLHKRVIKGVIRTKDEDTIFKLECAQRAKKFRLSYTKKGNVITFKLHEYDNIGAI